MAEDGFAAFLEGFLGILGSLPGGMRLAWRRFSQIALGFLPRFGEGERWVASDALAHAGCNEDGEGLGLFAGADTRALARIIPEGAGSGIAA